MYRSEQLVFHGNKTVPIVIRNYEKKDFDELIGIQTACFPPPFPSDLWWNKEQLHNHVTIFPEAALCVEVSNKVVASLTGVCVDFDPSHPTHTWAEMTAEGYITNHNPHGNTIYIVDISVHPAYRALGLGKLIMHSMYHVVIQKRLERLLGGSRMPGYHQHANKLTAEEYLQAVITGELRDPVISFLLRCGRVPITIIENYLEDKESLNYGVLMEWQNPFKRDYVTKTGS